MKKLIIVLTMSGALLSFSSAYSAKGGAGSFLRIGAGARPLGMAGAFTAVANDVYATYWNPAGLTQLKSLQLGSMYSIMSLDRQLSYLSFAVPFSENVVFGMSILDYRITEIDLRDESENLVGTFKNSEDALAFSIGVSPVSWFSIGGNFKYLFQKLSNGTATGYGFDIGTLLKPSRFLSIGFLVQDINSSVRWDTASGQKDKFPMHIRGGIALKLWHERVLISTDIASTEEENQFNTAVVHTGIEVWPMGSVAMRGGYYKGDLTWGATLNYSNFQIDYGLARDRIDFGTTHRISVLISF